MGMNPIYTRLLTSPLAGDGRRDEILLDTKKTVMTTVARAAPTKAATISEAPIPAEAEDPLVD